jgi:uncharacterized protein YfaS (alpha-2-macroglobulin family)
MLPIYMGQDITIVTEVINTSTVTNYQQVALSHVLPGGFEINNARMTGESATQKVEYNYQDIRDDRILTYFALAKGQTKTFTYRVTGAYAGRFRLPSVRVEAMYDASIQALIPGQWLDILTRLK